MDEQKNVTPIGEAKWTYTKDDFLTGKKPYEELYALKDDPFLHRQTMEAMSDYAKTVGYKGLKKTYEAYCRSLKGESIRWGNVTDFTGQKMELETGPFEANDMGVSDGDDVACSHPIMPVERLVNIDTGVEKLKIAFRRGNGQWRSIIAEKSVLASRQKILALSDMGVSVNSETAPNLVRYLSEVEDRNYDKIPQSKSIGRLGYIKGEGFSPYVDGLIFDGDLSFRDLFQSVSQHGDFKTWIAIAKECRQMSTTAKIVLAASFASPLLDILGALPFYVHLWGVDSGTGKTVALMLAASVWGDPTVGKYVKTFDATAVGLEKTAAFLNHLPLCLDELQLNKDGKGRISHDVYKLAQGVGRTRGSKFGGVERTPTWKNTILTTGESPLTNQNAGAGAVNRVIDIECKASEAVITDGMRVANTVKANYGLAGKDFVTVLYNDAELRKEIVEEYQRVVHSLSSKDTTEKQAMAAGAVLIADALISDLFFDNENPLTEDEISEFLASKAVVSAGERGYQWLLDWVAQNQNKFVFRQDEDLDRTDTYGRITLTEIEIIVSIFDKCISDAGFSPSALKSWMKQNGKIRLRKDGRGLTVQCRVTKTMSRPCICVFIPPDDEEDIGDEYLLP